MKSVPGKKTPRQAASKMKWRLKGMEGSVKGVVRLKSLSKFRSAKKLTQNQLAELLGICSRQVCRWETGESRPREAQLERLCKVLGCTEIQLLRAPRSSGSQKAA